MSQDLEKAGVLRQRNPLRLRDYDYAEPGSYFVTTNTDDRACWFGDVVDGLMRLNEIGRIAHDRWIAIPAHHPTVALDAFVVMPNHVRGILHILARPGSTTRGEAGLAPTREGTGPDKRSRGGAKAGSLGAVVGSFKAGVSRRVAQMRSGERIRIWQPGYQDHIVRADGELDRIRQYIAANPANWARDRENPNRTAGARQASSPRRQRHEGLAP